MSIIVGYDGSNAARAALKLAQKHAKAFGAKIEVVQSVTREHPLAHWDIQAAEIFSVEGFWGIAHEKGQNQTTSSEIL